MRFIVTVEKDSFTGQWIQGLGHDGTNGGHPQIDCESMDASHHCLLHVVRGPLETPTGSGRQSVYIPYRDVLQVLEYAKEDRQVGFSASS